MSATNVLVSVSVPLAEAPLALPKVLLVDDDPVFCKIMSTAGKAMGYDIEPCVSVRQVYRKLPDITFRVAVLDYDLGLVTGVQLARFTQRFHSEVPIILVSEYDLQPKADWPDSIRAYVKKSDGPRAIMEKIKQISLS
jgi:DNA-binding response OmpR family regulator